MVPHDRVKQQLQSIGADYKFLGRAEIRELPKILFEDEFLQHVVFGKYSGGFALLCATNQRILLVDKKPFYLTLEDIRYDMISDMMFNNRLIDTSLMLGTVHKSITFTCYNQAKLRNFTTYLQKRVMDSRMHQNSGISSQPIDGLFGTYAPAQPTSDIAVSARPSAMSPYRNPVIIRRRASKFFG